jgi:hypothetical protein
VPDGVGELAIETADLAGAAGAVQQAFQVATALPARLAVGTHDTHAQRLDAALDAFATSGAAAESMLCARVGALGLLFAAADRGYSAVELALARALAP